MTMSANIRIPCKNARADSTIDKKCPDIRALAVIKMKCAARAKSLNNVSLVREYPF